MDRNGLGPAVVALSLGAALLYALTSVLQQRVASAVPAAQSMRPSLVLSLVRRPLWLSSILLDVAAYGVQFLALRAGPLVVVQVLMVVGLLFALPLGAWSVRRWPRPSDWAATLLVMAGLGLFLAVATPSAGTAEASGGAWLLLTTTVTALVLALLWLGRTGSDPRRAGLLGAAAGILFGLTAAVTKAAGHLLDQGLRHTFGSWQPYAVVALALIGLLLSQSAFHAGPLQASLPLLTAAEPLAGAAIGVGIFHERISTDLLHLGLETAAVVLLLLGVVAVARSPLVLAVHAPQAGRLGCIGRGDPVLDGVPTDAEGDLGAEL